MAIASSLTRNQSSTAGLSTMRTCLRTNARFSREAIRKIPQQAVKTELDISPTQQEVKAAIAKLKRHKAPGVNGVPAEVYKYGGDTLLAKLIDLFQECWECGVATQSSRCRHSLSVQEQRSEIRVFQLQRRYTTIHCGENLGKGTAGQTHSFNRRRSPVRKSVWVQS